MELFHHYLTSKELGADKSSEAETIHSRLPRLGFAYHYVLRLILVLSGFHLARIKGSYGLNYYAEAERHFEAAVQEVSSAITLLDKQNCQALYTAAVLIFICSFAKGPQPDEFLGFRDDGNQGYLFLIMGIRSILENCRTFLSTDVLAIHAEPAGHDDSSQEVCSVEAFGYSDQIGQLHDLVAVEIASEDDDRYTTYIAILDRLHWCFESIYGTHLLPTDAALWPHIFSWLYMLPAEFVVDLQHRKPVALVIFASYAVLLRRLNFVWFMRGWSEHIVTGSYQFVHEGYQQFLQWPMEQVML